MFENLRSLVDPENFTVINKTITEYKILDNFNNPQLFSTEIVELLSKFLELNDNLEKTSGNWFDVNLKLISKNHFK